MGAPSDGHELFGVDVFGRNTEATEAVERGGERRQRPADEDVGGAQVVGQLAPEQGGIDEAGLALPAGMGVGEDVIPMPPTISTTRSACGRVLNEPCGPSSSTRVPGRSSGARRVKPPYALIVNAGRSGTLALEE
jgi:hypothetical protein